MGLLHRIGLLLLLTVVFLALAQTEAAPVSSQGAVADDADDADTEGLEFDVDANVANILKTFGINNLDDLNIDDDKPGKGQLVDIKRLFGRNNGPGTTTSSSSRIKNVIVFVLENRSFDRTLGHLKIPGQKIDNLVGKQFYNLVNVSNPKSRKVYSSTNSTYWELCPSHTFPSVYEQVYGVPFPGQDPVDAVPLGKVNGFVQNFNRTFWTPTQLNNDTWKPYDLIRTPMYTFGDTNKELPILANLAQEFAVFDQWHAAVPGPTAPNRAFWVAGTASGMQDNIPAMLKAGLVGPTIFNHLEENGVPWVVYFEEYPCVIFQRNIRQTKFLVQGRFRGMDRFFIDLKVGKLPRFSFLEPNYGPYFWKYFGPLEDDEHAPSNVARGEQLLKKIYEAFRASPYWKDTLLLVSYDEHGGFADHVVPPQSPQQPIPPPDSKVGTNGFTFNRLGIRVATVAISPWIKKGNVVHQPWEAPVPKGKYAKGSTWFTHTSMAATVKKLFNLPSFLTKRDAWSPTIDFLWSESEAGVKNMRTDCPMKLPKAPTGLPPNPIPPENIYGNNSVKPPLLFRRKLGHEDIFAESAYYRKRRLATRMAPITDPLGEDDDYIGIAQETWNNLKAQVGKQYGQAKLDQWARVYGWTEHFIP